MRIYCQNEYIWLGFGTLAVIKSGSVSFCPQSFDKIKFVKWWPVNWFIVPVVYVSVHVSVLIEHVRTWLRGKD